jgi:hypothetical protein
MKKKSFKEYYIFFTSILFIIIFLAFLTERSFFVNDDFTMLELKFDNYLEAIIFVDLWWRPIKSIFYNFFNNNFYLNTHLIILSKILIHACLTIIIFFYLIYLKHNEIKVLFLSLLFFIAQTSVTAVIGVDTLGQLIFTFFGILSFMFLDFFIKSKKKYKYLFLSYIFYSLALLAKESAIIFFLINSFYISYYSKINFFNKNKSLFNINIAFIVIFLFFFIFLIYFFIRFYLGANWMPNLSDNRTSFVFNESILYNFIYYFFSIINPIDNSFIYFLFKDRYFFFLLFITIFLLLIYFTIFLNIKFSKNLILLLISSIPTIFLNHVAELYTYVSVFFFILLISDSLSQKKTLILENIQKFFILILVIINFVSFSFKTYNMTYLSRLSSNFFYEMSSSRNEFSNKVIYYQNKVFKNVSYSNFKMTSLNQIVPIYFLSKNIGYNVENLIMNDLKVNDFENIIFVNLSYKNNIKYFNNFFAQPCILLQATSGLLIKEICGH